MRLFTRFLFAFFTLSNTLICIAQNAVLFSATPESYPGAQDGKIVATIANMTDFPSPYTFKISEMNKDPIVFANNTTGTVTFVGLGYKYYCITVIMGNGCSAYGCFQFDEPCASDGCLIAGFNYEYTSDGCTILFEDWPKGSADSWAWDFGDGSNSNSQNPTHTYTESKCYNVTLQASKGTLTRTLSKEVCVTSCTDVNAPPP